MTRFVKDHSPALTTLTADRSWTLATVAGVVVAKWQDHMPDV